MNDYDEQLHNMVTTTNGGESTHRITLNIRLPGEKNVHPMQCAQQLFIADFCQNIEQYLPIKHDHDASEYGLFIADHQHPSRSYWLDPSKTLNYYLLKNEVRKERLAHVQKFLFRVI